MRGLSILTALAALSGPAFGGDCGIADQVDPTPVAQRDPPPSVAAEDNEAASADTICPDAFSTVEMTDCAWEHYEAADAELNRVWQRVLAEIDSTPLIGMPLDQPASQAAERRKEWRAEMVKAQRAWIAFRDSDCHVVIEYEFYGGSGASLAFALCLHGHTQRRIGDLRERYFDETNN